MLFSLSAFPIGDGPSLYKPIADVIDDVSGSVSITL